eukprot:1937507-Pleurochrysis_carterae.AAC.4
MPYTIFRTNTNINININTNTIHAINTPNTPSTAQHHQCPPMPPTPTELYELTRARQSKQLDEVGEAKFAALMHSLSAKMADRAVEGGGASGTAAGATGLGVVAGAGAGAGVGAAGCAGGGVSEDAGMGDSVRGLPTGSMTNSDCRCGSRNSRGPTASIDGGHCGSCGEALSVQTSLRGAINLDEPSLTVDSGDIRGTI